MLRNATRRSLLIIDEFGKGTDSNDGAGLFCGLIEFLLGLGRNTVSSFTELADLLMLTSLAPYSLASQSLLTSKVCISLINRDMKLTPLVSHQSCFRKRSLVTLTTHSPRSYGSAYS